ncbi:MAG: ABC transporter permease [Pyrinomonadaceae bacterium]|nr:ABC transporter permease [Pyrinomonadaceae bacterium]
MQGSKRQASVQHNVEQTSVRASQSLRDRTREGALNNARARHPLVELTLVRLREFTREPEAVFWVFVFPVLLTCALGIAFRNTAPEKHRVAVESSDRSGSQSSINTMAQSLKGSADIDVVVLSPAEAAGALRSGRVDLVVRSTDEGSQRAQSSPAPSFEYRYDPTRPESRMARLVADDALQRAEGRTDVTRARDERVTEPGARYIDFLIPGLVGLNLMGSGMWGIGFAIVSARTRKLLKRFAATPMRRSHYLFSFVLSRLVFLTLEVAAVIGFAWIVFGVAVQGSLVELAVALLLGGLMFAGIGLLVAARPRTVEGVSGMMNLVMLPMWLLSGTFFSSERFPEVLQPFIKALPLTALNDVLRGVMSNGTSLAANWPELIIMIVWGMVSFALALRLFRWQ